MRKEPIRAAKKRALGVPLGCDRLNISKLSAIKGIFYVSKIGLF
jgi:hypothetical protein